MANYTEHYQLHQWEPQDDFLRADFNQDHQKLDDALHGLAQHDAALDALVSQCGNCQVYTTTYTGTGKYGAANPNTLTFPFKPALVMIIGNLSMGFTTFDSPYFINTEAYSCNASWSNEGKTVTWYHTSRDSAQLNSGNWLYCVTALGQRP